MTGTLFAGIVRVLQILNFKDSNNCKIQNVLLKNVHDLISLTTACFFIEKKIDVIGNLNCVQGPEKIQDIFCIQFKTTF